MTNQTLLPGRRRRLFGASLMAATLALGGVSGVFAPKAQAQVATTLTAEQRRAYLTFYAPVLLKRGDENNGKVGHDWMTNFDFDRDGNFSNNRVNWQRVPGHANGTDPSTAGWQVRPTMYTSLVEYNENGSKSLVLLYHVYNASDKDAKEIHDWERIEIIVRNVSGTPGSPGEAVSSATVTLHKEHHMRRPSDGEMNFLRTGSGNHLLVWQADESDIDGGNIFGGIGSFLANGSVSPHGHQLHFVTTPSWVVAQQLQAPTGRAEVRVSNRIGSPLSPKNVHYVFVPERAAATVAFAGAQTLNAGNARYLASRVDNGDRVGWNETKRLTYELQDLADITATQWSQNPRVLESWLPYGDVVDVLLEAPITNEAGTVEVPAGRQTFYSRSRDSQKGEDGRDGYITKNWLYGAYSAELNPEPLSSSDNFGGFSGVGTDSSGFSRGAASARPDSHGQYWWQHDFFVHNGVINKADTREEGQWLRGDWWRPENGGFDGRWTQLFDDGPTGGSVFALQASIRMSTGQCIDAGRATAVPSGGTAPYSFTWTGAASTSGSVVTVDGFVPVTLTVTDATGAVAQATATYTPTCGDGTNLQ